MWISAHSDSPRRSPPNPDCAPAISSASPTTSAPARPCELPLRAPLGYAGDVMVHPRALGLCAPLLLGTLACFNPSGTATTSSGGPGSSSGPATTSTTGTSETTQSGTSTVGSTAVEPTTGHDNDTSTVTSAAPSSSSSSESSSTGQMSTCGDLIAMPGVEECDDGDDDPNNGCDHCKRHFFAIFLTEPVTLSGGLDGADEACQTAAITVGRQGLFRAWLSDDTHSAASRMNHKDGTPYVLVNGAPVANTLDDLITLGPTTPIDRVIDAMQLPGGTPCVDDLVWTGTDGAGQGVLMLNCENWTTMSQSATVGSFKASGMGGSWTACGMTNCTSTARLYCFEQPLI